jgi:hypothetical protein
MWGSGGSWHGGGVVVVPGARTQIVMGRFGSELWFEPEPNRTEPIFRVRVWVLT